MTPKPNQKINKKGKIGILPGGNKIFCEDGKKIASYVTLTDEDAYLDENNVVHKGKPNL